MRDKNAEVCKISCCAFLAFSALSLLGFKFSPDQSFLIAVSIFAMLTSAFVAFLAITYRMWLQFLAAYKDTE